MSDDGKIRVLVGDDETDILDLLKYNLKKEGYQVKTALKIRQLIKNCLPKNHRLSLEFCDPHYPA